MFWKKKPQEPSPLCQQILTALRKVEDWRFSSGSYSRNLTHKNGLSICLFTIIFDKQHPEFWIGSTKATDLPFEDFERKLIFNRGLETYNYLFDEAKKLEQTEVLNKIKDLLK